MPPPDHYTPPFYHAHAPHAPHPLSNSSSSQQLHHSAEQNQPLHSHQSHSSHEPTSPAAPKRSNPLVPWAIWSRRPHDPAHAPGIIISPNAKPPPSIIEQALELPTPPQTPILPTQELEPAIQNSAPQPQPEIDAEVESTPSSSTAASSSVTETTDRDTPAVGSPISSVTSLSASLEISAKSSIPVSSTIPDSPSVLSTSPASVPSAPVHTAPTSTTPTPAPPKKSWAALLQSSTPTGASSSGRPRLPTSSVVGISISASALSAPQTPTSQSHFAHPALALPHAKRAELLNLLTSPPPPSTGDAPLIRPRGLINSGNMCFANSVLQVLVYCPPFHRLFTELARFGFGFRASEKEGKGPTPLVDAVVEFVREFSVTPAPKAKVTVTVNSKGGKGKGKEREEHEETDEEDGESFLPSYVYDAMKEKTVFDGMRSGQQEDAEEFLGFFLDALEEELLAVVQALTVPPPAKKTKPKAKKENGVEEREVEEEKEDGWLEVGKRNRMVVTRTVKAAETPITRLFGGKVRSTLKAPGHKDSVTVEAWRALRLDIQPDSIKTLPDALAHMAAPQTLELDPPRHASMQHLLEAVPPVLVVHLKRFCYDKDVGGVVKIGKEVHWGDELEVGGDIMAPTLKRAPPARYKLFGAIQTKTSGGASRGTGKKGGSRGRGGGNQSNRGRGGRANGSAPTIKAAPVLEEKVQAADSTPATDGDDDADVCWICAEPVKYYSVSECNHRTCHVCALRLRALYKKTDCTFCKEPQSTVIFTVSPDALFASYAPESISFKDTKLSIFFETQEMMEETLILLRFNCPDSDCAYIGNGWGDLKLHVRATHGKLMCDLCIRSKKVFAHEHALYPPNILSAHLPSMHHRPHGKPVPKDQIEGGVHPLCEFCRECFFGDDELYAHMREKHEECFICKRNEVRDQYFQNYESLENHFNRAHHPCTQSQCLVRKFVVFNTPLDLQAHMVDEHGSDMSSRDKKHALRVQAEFEFEEVGVGGRHGRRDRGHRDRDREPPPHQRQAQQENGPAPSAPPPGVVRPPGPGRRREGFGASLTVDGPSAPSPQNATPQQSRPPSPPRGDIDPEIAERHAMFIARLQSLAANPGNGVPVVKAAIRGYRSSESSAKDLISTIWNVLDQNLEHTASIVNAFVDLLDQEDKKTDLLASWKGFEVEQRRQFPDLIPTAVASGSAAYAAITTGRVLNAKHATATRSSQRSSRQVWDRVAQAAGSSLAANQTHTSRPVDRFPALPSSSGPSNTAAHRGSGQRNTPWSASSSGYRPSGPMPTPAQASSTHLTIIPNPQSSQPSSGRNTPKQPPPKLSNALFPELPTAASTRPKATVSGNVSLQKILGNPAPPVVPAWAAGGSNSNPGTPTGQAGEGGDGDASAAPGKGKKGKGKQKQTLFTLGSFPT
ncbi:hypothetical protein DXG03_001874 [Asterophora parasitica]|uniref:RING-type E3 ubiquitin transferase n=1 Tax=Asterophora parasitica TaxID=117018 RepID=A0A9P7G3I8_9AGAR|nr:hypothetical protein DXG03_001874 [Asterophora parasitica]